MDRSIRLLICECGRPFDHKSGQPLRNEKEGWIPPEWKKSHQKCILCDKDFYIKKTMDHIEKIEGDLNVQ